MKNTNSSNFNRLRHKLKTIAVRLYQIHRIWKYRLISDINQYDSLAKFNQPVLLSGKGRVHLGRCNLGVWPSPYFLNGYIHIEARTATASVTIEDGVWINNNAVIISEKSEIHIKSNTLIGTGFTVYDSDFHNLDPSQRITGTHKCKPVSIGKNVFIGSNVMIMKGSSIGDNSVIASGSIVTSAIPDNCIAGGIPARAIRKI